VWNTAIPLICIWNDNKNFKNFVMKKLPVILLALAIFSCSGIRVLNSESNQGFKLSDCKTYNFYELEASGDTAANFSSNAELLKKEIEKQLALKGLRRSDTEPDLRVNIGIVVQEKIQTRETSLQDAPRYMGQRNYSWKIEEIEVGRYKEGTVTVHLVDPDNSTLMWKGAVEGILPSNKSKLPSTIQEGMEKLFSKLI
jgi:hypothetical protein